MRAANWYEMIVDGQARNLHATTHARARRECRAIVNAENIESDYRIRHTYGSGRVEFIAI
jgi:hypothetical protein